MSPIERLAGQFSKRSRAKRAALFRKLFSPDQNTKILDLGSETGANIKAVLEGTPVQPRNVYIADIDSKAVTKGREDFGFTPVVVSESGPLPFPDGFFDIVYSSSVIEHVTVPKAIMWKLLSGRKFHDESRRTQKAFADEIRRVGKRYFVQTPYKHFPIESHTWLPFVAWLPRWLLVPTLHFTNLFWVKTTIPDFYLLDKRELSQLFDGARIIEERSFGMIKSIMAVSTGPRSGQIARPDSVTCNRSVSVRPKRSDRMRGIASYRWLWRTAAAFALLLGAVVLLAACRPGAKAPPTTEGGKIVPITGQRLFASGFEGTTAIVPPNQASFWGTGGFADITGTDDTTGFAWPPSIWGGGGGRFLFLTDPVVVGAADVGSYMFNRIETVTGPKGNQTKALYQQISRNVNGTEPMGESSTQNEFDLHPTSETSDLYISYWLKFQPDLAEKMNNLPAGPGIRGGGTWRAFFALKTGTQKPVTGPLNAPRDNGDYRVEVYVQTYGGGTPYWEVLADNDAGGGAPLVNSWAVQNRTVPVPAGEWFKFEFFLHRSNGADGRVWVAINGNTIADHKGPNMGAWNLPINRIMIPILYTGSRMPVYQWVDDVEIWNGFPPVGTPGATETQ